MQTFLPYPDFAKSASCLDNKRLNKQIVECKQILMALSGESKAWRNHPAVLMWKGHENALREYASCMCVEFNKRTKKIHSIAFFFNDSRNHCIYPLWIGYDPFHSAHRAILLAKDFEHYSQFGWTETPAVKNEQGSYPYVWPSKMPEFNMQLKDSPK